MGRNANWPCLGGASGGDNQRDKGLNMTMTLSDEHTVRKNDFRWRSSVHELIETIISSAFLIVAVRNNLK